MRQRKGPGESVCFPSTALKHRDGIEMKELPAHASAETKPFHRRSNISFSTALTKSTILCHESHLTCPRPTIEAIWCFAGILIQMKKQLVVLSWAGVQSVTLTTHLLCFSLSGYTAA